MSLSRSISIHFAALAALAAGLAALATGSSGCRRYYPTGSESNPVACTNGIDDDGDFASDCDDPGCSAYCGAGSDAGTGSDGGGGLCGNGILEGQEDCDGSNLNGESCFSLGFAGGTLVCTGGCLFNTVNCTGGGTCGDDTCGESESCSTCPTDCGSCCGDGTCAGGETCSTCPSDCGGCGGSCGDFVCSGTETCSSCAVDCGSCCGNGLCSGGETCSTCPSDCGSCCGNGVCSGGETCTTCPSDCGSCCGNGLCSGGETCSTCPSDCGGCGSVCGDFVCGATETCSCVYDCGGYNWTEDFSDNFAGWTIGTEWSIAPAVAGTSGDPGTDHTAATTDNGIAGVVIGGTYSSGLHSFYYLTSPYLDTSYAIGTMYLEFWRWLQSDYTPYVDNTIDVYNGSSWVNVYDSGATGVSDASWMYEIYDITAYKNAFMQIRWGFNVGSTGVITDAGWNIDDVKVYTSGCP